MAFRRFLISAALTVIAVLRLSAQENGSQVDSLVRLLSAKSMQLIEKNGVDFRKVTGPARFLHNDTFLICDTALWNVNTNEIFAINNVKILQDQTVLTSDRLTYYVDRDLAEFRGSLVQLEDKDRNILRTENLDYNTRDSVAVFFHGGSMKDKDGQIIESVTGTYDSKAKTFTFNENVNMFTDSIFVRTTNLIYDSGINVARFGFGTDAWQEDNMLSSNSGWYDRNRDIFLFNRNVHGMSEDQEGWADSLYYYKYSGDIELLGNAQVMDTTRDVSALAGRIYYSDSLARIVMTRKPVVIGIIESENAAPDSVYFGADTIVSRSLMRFQIDTAQIVNSKARLDGLAVDAVTNYRQKAAKAAAEAAAKAAEGDPNRPPQNRTRDNQAQQASQPEVPQPQQEVPEETEDVELPPADSLKVVADSLKAPLDSLLAGPDSLSIARDSLSVAGDSLSMASDSLDAEVPVVLDSTKFNFITAIGNVKIFKSDIQMACDSLEYCDLDSLVRLYRNPLVWNEGNRQYSADSLYAVIRNNALEKASLMSNAFVIVQEDTLCFDQIRATEMLAYFDTTGALRRFDALGDANAIFYLQEDSVYATVNKSSAKMLYATFADGSLDRAHYFEDAKTDVYPLAQMRSDERVLKGFNWLPEKRPRGKFDISPLSLRETQRKTYSARPKTTFKFTDKYFPGYMSGVYKQIADGKIAKQRAAARKKAAPDAQVPQDSLAVADSMATAVLPPVDSLSVKEDSLARKGRIPSADSLSVTRDSLSVAADSIAQKETAPDPKALKAAAKAAKIAEREAKWARLDSLDAAKTQAKLDKKAAKLRAKKLEAIKAMNKQEQKDNARLERYRQRYVRKKAKEDARAAAKSEKSDESEKIGKRPSPVTDEPDPISLQ